MGLTGSAVLGWKGTPGERFWRFIEPEPMSGCWLWTGTTNPSGYGHFAERVDQHRTAHRYAWTVFRGPIPSGVSVLHKCDVPPCCNPDHLFLGTQRENMRDCAVKGRSASGARLPQTRVTAEQVREIRQRRTQGESARAVGIRFGISQWTVFDIGSGRTWKETKEKPK